MSNEKAAFFTFDLDEMLRDFTTFDPLEYRYQLKKAKRDMAGRSDLYEWEKSLLSNLQRYHSAHTPLDRINADKNGMLENLRLTYGDKEPIEKYMRIYEIIQQKLIREYLEIDGIAQLFNPKYFDFEWEMHLRLDYDKHTQGFYRDHFIHQAKNAYEVMRLFVEMPTLFNDMLSELKKGESTVSAYLAQFVNEEYIVACGNSAAREILEALYQDPKEANPAIAYSEPAMAATEHKAAFDRAAAYKKNAACENILKNIIKGSLIIASLIHDIGYPLNHTIVGQDLLSQFVPTAHYFLGASSDFASISGRLSGSLLFQIVGVDKVRAAFEKPLHGMSSAIAFLLYYYDTGLIHKLTPAKRATIEFAALIMADHTNEYELLDEKSPDYYRPAYVRNPLSFLFRICDDIQEWGRVYFYVSSNDALRVCKHCGLPIVHCNFTLDSGGTVAHPHKVRKHVCGCRDIGEGSDLAKRLTGAHKNMLDELLRNGGDDAYISISDMQYRKINHMQYSERVRFYNLEHITDKNFEYLAFLPTYEKAYTINSTPKNATGAYLLHIDYNLYKLLQGSIIQPAFAKHRSGEVIKLKKLLNNNAKFPTVIIHSDVTTNPISLKVKILERYLVNMYSRWKIADRLLRDPAAREADPELNSYNGNENAHMQRYSSKIIKGSSVLGEDEYIFAATALNDPPQTRLAALQIHMLLGSELKFGISEIENLKQRIKTNLGDDASTATVDEEQIKGLLTMLNDGSRYDSRVGFDRWTFLESAVNVYEGLSKASKFEKLGEENTKPFIARLCNAPEQQSLTLGAINVDDTAYAAMDSVACSVKKLRKSAVSLLCDLTNSVYSSVSINASNTKTKASNHLLLYYEMLAASKLLLLAKDVAKALDTAESSNGRDTWLAAKKAGFDVEKHYIKPLRNDLLEYFKNAPEVHAFIETSGNDSLSVLIEDFFLQESRHINYYDYAYNNRVLPDDYFNIYKQAGYIEDAIVQYTQSENYKNFIFAPNDSLEFYSDLFLFNRLSNATQ